MDAPDTESMSASSDCDNGERTCDAAAIAIQPAMLMPKYLRRRSTACRQLLAMLYNAFSNRSARSVALPGPSIEATVRGPQDGCNRVPTAMRRLVDSTRPPQARSGSCRRVPGRVAQYPYSAAPPP